MAAPELEFFYDYSCPYAYLASTQIRGLAERAGARLTYRPFLLGGVFRALGEADGMLPGTSPNRQRMNGLDMHRWAEHWGVPLNMPAGHPNRTVTALRATLASDDVPRATHALFAAYWERGEDLSAAATVARALDDAGFDGPRLVARAADAEVKDELRRRTDEAISRGVFGAPASFVGGELFWGQDRLDFVAEALGAPGAAPRGAAPPPDGPAVPIDFWFDFSSPFAYLASTQIVRVAARAGAPLRWKPFLLGGLFKIIGTPTVPLQTFSPPKQRHYMADMQRFGRRYGVELSFPSRFPMNTVTPLRAVLSAGDDAARLAHALFAAYWVEDRDIASDEVLRSICATAGVDAGVVDRAAEPEAKAALRAATDEAAALGICGAPSFAVGGSVFWGQDRLDFVERAARGWRPRVG